MRITFRTKLKTVHNRDVEETWIKVPAITRAHCDMPAFRQSRRFGSYANSDLFLGMIRRELSGLGIHEYLKLHDLPDFVDVDASGYLAAVTITLSDERK